MEWHVVEDRILPGLCVHWRELIQSSLKSSHLYCFYVLRYMEVTCYPEGFLKAPVTTMSVWAQ